MLPISCILQKGLSIWERVNSRMVFRSFRNLKIKKSKRNLEQRHRGVINNVSKVGVFSVVINPM